MVETLLLLFDFTSVQRISTHYCPPFIWFTHSHILSVVIFLRVVLFTPIIKWCLNMGLGVRTFIYWELSVHFVWCSRYDFFLKRLISNNVIYYFTNTCLDQLIRELSSLTRGFGFEFWERTRVCWESFPPNWGLTRLESELVGSKKWISEIGYGSPKKKCYIVLMSSHNIMLVPFLYGLQVKNLTFDILILYY